MTLLVPRNMQSSYFSYQVQLLDLCLLHYMHMLNNDKAMTLLIVSSLLTLLFKNLNKKKLN